MKLLLDQGVPRTAARLLRESGLDAVHVGKIGMDRATARLLNSSESKAEFASRWMPIFMPFSPYPALPPLRSSESGKKG